MTWILVFFLLSPSDQVTRLEMGVYSNSVACRTAQELLQRGTIATVFSRCEATHTK